MLSGQSREHETPIERRNIPYSKIECKDPVRIQCPFIQNQIPVLTGIMTLIDVCRAKCFQMASLRTDTW
jgi:hypothetical protein